MSALDAGIQGLASHKSHGLITLGLCSGFLYAFGSHEPLLPFGKRPVVALSEGAVAQRFLCFL